MSGPKTALITGVARSAGIGHSCAKAFLRSGYRVVGLDVANPDKPLQSSLSTPYHFLQLDLTNASHIMCIRDQLDSIGVGQVNVLINNAGIANPYMPTDPAARVESWQTYIAVNLTGKLVYNRLDCIPGQVLLTCCKHIMIFIT